MNANKSGRYGRPLRAAVLALVLALGLTTMGGLAGAGRAGLGTTTALAAGTSTIWPDTATPVTTVDSDPNAVELGVKFRTDVDGYVTGVRFWKGTPNTGTHTGNLWTSTGTRLATAVFTTETSSGWQQVDFGAPVPVTAGTTYVASYHTTSGYYAADADFFATSGVDNPPLHALRDGVDGSNGVYSYSATSTFPTQSWRASNYWVDVVFTSTVAPDTTAPTVTSVVPADGATGVARTAPVSAVFSEAMDPATISTSTVTLVPTGGATPVAATVAYDAATRSLSLQPSASLAPVTGYTATIKGGASGVKDLAGNPLAQDRTWSFTTGSSGPCDTPANATVAENCLPGSPASEWDVSGAGDPSIQGFATDISVTRPQSGQTTTVSFKIDTTASAYRIDIYRLGYYGGQGARKVASITPTDVRKQSNCLTDATTGLIDCGNWRVSATWTVPSAATSGLYIARPVRSDTGGASHVPFVVRDDARTSDVLVQTSDTTWQAYNTYGGNSLYTGSPDGRAYKVSYNRPFVTRGVDGGQDWLFNAEYPMIRWLERNGYDVSYQSGIDTDRLGATPLGRHRTFLSVGHDEYWSGGQRANVESARGTGLNLAFFSGNEVFWKTRWETSIDGSGTAYRTLVCYKETHANAKIDPSPSWTGTWRDPRFSPPSDGGRPENALTGTIFMVNDGATTSIVVPEADGKMRFWRGTSIASLSPGSSATLPNGTLGYEWDSDLDNGSRPVGTVRLSSTTVPNAPVLQDYGSTYGSGTARHNLTLYRQQGGGLVFGAGTVQWTWGLDATHDRSGTPVSVPMQQATVNLLADMGAQPATIATGLSPATASTDQTPPTAAISSPAPGAVIAPGATMTVSGTASDVGGRVGGVEVSTDGGTSWHPATGRASWTYQWTAGSAGSVTIRARAADDSANLGSAASVTVSVGSTTTDTTAPKVVSVSPVSGATGVGVSSGVSAVFDEA
ncbi:Ig-like domain-containing protein, partial [Raineyella antarctica]